ncbi:ParB-like protein [Sphingobium sp. SYK-6]|uniref:ParB/RepB/Spo0J family partition protein n=1 Tax=Sphingobium sp. (strain NBRC 103272 / SYK-6) TaxID=627192 RepID=UPI000227772D|nr:ParB N-terminal domain-containing protein [Sphingobium sp. SYK-6]BAK67294.1 ParB-like protein [Sphingobium sp. SYK-6]
MKLDFIDHDKLFIDKTNMRYGRRALDVSDIIATVRKRGIILPLLVKPANDEGRCGIVAGARRWTADGIARAEGIDHGPLPCAILGDGDDAAAIEASMIENMARLDPDEVTQWESFARLVREGRDVADISETFGLPELTVRRVLALGNLLPRIRDLYRREKIDAATVRHLTLARESQQKAWLALIDDPQARAPTGHQVKAWLFGGQAIPVRHALFDVDSFKGPITGDLFGEDRYFADADAFWTAQNAAIETKKAAYLENGWSDVVIVPPGEHFQTWEHERAQKRKGGRVYIALRANGEVVFHEGYLTRKEARRAETGATPASGTKPVRAELTSTLAAYVHLHRHAAVRAALLSHPAVALRLMVAHAIVGSHLWSVKPDPQTARNDAVRESVETCLAETRFDEHRRAVFALLGFSPEEATVTGGNGDDYGVASLFLRLLNLSDPALMEVIVLVMGETLAVGSAAVDAVGACLTVDMADWWQADAALFELIRDKEVLGQIVAEMAGEQVASANADETTMTLKRIVRDHLDGKDGRTRVERWVPKWMAFPPAAYTARGGVATVAAHARVEAARAMLAGEAEAEPMALAA